MARAEAAQHHARGDKRSHQAVPPTGDGERCLETFLVVPPGLGAIDSRWAEARDAAQYHSHAQGGLHRGDLAPNISGARVGRTVGARNACMCAVFWGMVLFLSCYFLS